MHGLWQMTWHENHVVNPGVPDLSYVMAGSGYETGWLELKAVRFPEDNAVWSAVQFHVEPSQHEWIKNHCNRVPVHLLLDLHGTWYLLGGELHWRLANPIDAFELSRLSRAHGNRDEMRSKLSAALREITSRYRG